MNKNNQPISLFVLVLIVINILLILGIILWPVINRTNHTAHEPYYFVIPFVVTGGVFLTIFLLGRDRLKLSVAGIMISLLGVLLLFSYKHFNIMLNYDEWLIKGMPDSFESTSTELWRRAIPDSQQLVPLKLENKVRISNGDIKELITKDLRKNGIKGDIENEIIIYKIESTELFKNSLVILYSISLDYAWLKQIYILNEDTIIGKINGDDPYIGDLDKNGYYEVYSNFTYGSGLVSSHISGYNIKTKTVYELGQRGENDTFLFLEDNKLMARIVNAKDFSSFREEMIFIEVKSDTTELDTMPVGYSEIE